MMPVSFSAAQLSKDESVKQNAAVKQMRDLMERLEVGEKYRMLTQQDRQTLISEGYARDLVDNVVFITQRLNTVGLGEDNVQDRLITGFTYAAFDPSIYACASIRKNLQTLTKGCCAYCETNLEVSGSAIVAQFRPPATLYDAGNTLRSPYFALAYEQNNLLYTCDACSEVYKRDRFPAIGQRLPRVSLEQEDNQLIHPYFDNPRDFIRFNPLNASAYAYDSVQAFYRQQYQMSSQEIEKMLWRKSGKIPSQYDKAGSLISDPQITAEFLQWQKDNNFLNSRGQISIDLLGLNRAALLCSRYHHLRGLFSLYTNQWKQGIGDIDLDKAEAVVDQWLTQAGACYQYSALSRDALNTWLMYDKADETSAELEAYDWLNIYSEAIHISTGGQTSTMNSGSVFRNWLTSSLIYIVLESELSMENKRRLVSLSANDYLYGSDNPDKCVFVGINWETDTHNAIKVRSKNHVWETSFQELADSRPLEIMSLFENNEVWAEGRYPALI